MGGQALEPLEKLESRSIYILREAYAAFGNLCMLWSIGKDSTVLLWLARKAFFGHVPFPLVHIDTHYKIPEMIEYRDRLAREYGLYMVYGENREALDGRTTYPDGAVSRVECCRLLKTQALAHTLDGSWPRYRLNLDTGAYEIDPNRAPYTGVIVGVRSDEEGSRSKERYFSSRDKNNDWNLDDQPPEFWNQFKTDFAPGTHVRIHPLLDWTELNIWEYIERERIPTVSLYYNQGDGRRYRSLGCAPCTMPIQSTSRNPAEIIEELRTGALANIAERSGRAQDKEDGGGLETLRRDGYM
jgi:sulfate adenylyltransferase subunit 2